ncbi:MAG: NHLP bacteriocin system secretion protein [Pseudomonadota bacterium]
MAKEIFRKAALERMASPERTDHPTRLVGSSGWLILSAFLVAILAGAAWAIQTQAPVKVTAQGILIDRAGLVEIASEQGGVLEEVRIQPGDPVKVGQVVASLSRSELRRELAAARAKLDDLKNRFERLQIANEARTDREGRSDQQRLLTIAQTRKALQERQVLLESRAEKLEPLARRKVVPEVRLIEAQIAVSDVNERLAGLEEDSQKIMLDAAERASQREISELEDRLDIEEQVRIIERLKARLSEEKVVTSTHAGQVVEIKVNPGDVLAPGAALATLAPLDLTRNLQALMYVPPAEGKRIIRGMVAEIAPTTVEREVYGHIEGEVVSVAPLPATPEGMRRVLQNDQLVEQLSVGGAPIEVRLSLTRSADTPTGFAWSSSDGPASGVNAGTLLEGKVIVEKRPLLDLMLPGATATLDRVLDRGLQASGVGD